MIANGVADDPPVRDRGAVRAELGVAPSAFLAVLVAAPPQKRATVFVEQVSAAHAIEPSVQGVVVGDGPDASVGRAVRRSGGAVRMLGYRADAVDIMHAGDVVCLTSAVEALPDVRARGDVCRPAGDRNPRWRVVRGGREPGRTGFLISPDRPSELGHALVNLARDPARAEELGLAGRARQRRAFTIEAMTRGYAELLADLDRTRGTGARRPLVPVTS